MCRYVQPTAWAIPSQHKHICSLKHFEMGWTEKKWFGGIFFYICTFCFCLNFFYLVALFLSVELCIWHHHVAVSKGWTLLVQHRKKSLPATPYSGELTCRPHKELQIWAQYTKHQVNDWMESSWKKKHKWTMHTWNNVQCPQPWGWMQIESILRVHLAQLEWPSWKQMAANGGKGVGEEELLPLEEVSTGWSTGSQCRRFSKAKKRTSMWASYSAPQHIPKGL